jgi:hypothetical protein
MKEKNLKERGNEGDLDVWKWDDKFKVDLKETECEGMNRIHLAQNKNQWWALVKMIMNF